MMQFQVFNDYGVVMGEGYSVTELEEFLNLIKDDVDSNASLLVRTWCAHPDKDTMEASKRGVVLTKVIDNLWSYSWLTNIEESLQADFAALHVLPGIAMPLSFDVMEDIPDNLVEVYYSDLPNQLEPIPHPADPLILNPSTDASSSSANNTTETDDWHNTQPSAPIHTAKCCQCHVGFG